MNAFELYNAVYDSARDAFLPENPTREELIQDVIDYAFNAYDNPVNVSHEIAEKIVDAHSAYQAATWGENGNGQYENNMFYCVQEPLEEIEL